MVKDISNVSSLIKYLEYLLDYSDLIYSQNDLTENLYRGLKKETQVFHDMVDNAEFIPPLLKGELLKIMIKEKYKNSSWFKFSKYLYRKFLFWKYESSYEDIKSERRGNIKEYRDRLENIYKAILVKS